MLENKARTQSSESMPQVVEWRARIIEDILKNGLKSNLLLRNEGVLDLPSLDGENSHEVPGIRGRIVESEFMPWKLQLALYRGGWGVLPVIIERAYPGDFLYSREYWSKELDPEKIKILSGRARSSFLVVTTNVADGETKYVDLIPADSFHSIVLPDDIFRDFSRSRANFNVSQATTTLTSGVIRRKVEAYCLEVPDYETPLIEIIDELEQSIWIHGVRLPTQEDLERLQAK